MIARLYARPKALVALGFSFCVAALYVGLYGRVAPWRAFGPVEIGNDLIATVGLVWAVIQIWSNRRDAGRRLAWLCAAAGAGLIAAEDHLEDFIAPLGPTLFGAALSAAMWVAAAYLFFACGRRYAMRRHVMTTMYAALGVELAAQALGLALAIGPSAPSRALQTAQDSGELLTVLLYVVALVLTQVAPLKDYRFPRTEIGRRARRLFYDFGLFVRPRYPTTSPILQIPGVSHLFIVVMILWFAPRSAGAVRRASGRSAARQVLDMLRLGFTEGVDAKSYYIYDLYRPTPRSAADETITRVETKNGLTKTLQGLGADPRFPSDMNDKLEFWRVCEANGVFSAPIFANVDGGAVVYFTPRASFDRDLFVKDRSGRGGRFVLNFRRIAPFIYRDDEGVVRDLDSVIERLEGFSAKRNLIVQPKLENHPAIRSLADKALLVFRVVTCLDERGEPQVTHGVLRIIRRFEPDWPRTPDADWGCAIDLETGRFGMMTGDAPETCTKWFADHPVTGERVFGRILEGWPEIAETALAAHRVFRGRIVVGWDVAWTPEGACILEGNSNMDFSFFQRCYRTPVGRSPLGPLLNAHLDALTARLLDAES